MIPLLVKIIILPLPLPLPILLPPVRATLEVRILAQCSLGR